jgi:hypothetical protein
MIRPLTLFWFLIAATAVGMVFVISHEVTLRERQLDRMRVEVQKTRDRIHVLRAEWAYLGRPQYLQQLASQHLGLTPIPPDRIVELNDLPRPEERKEEPVVASAKNGKPGAPAAPAKPAARAATPTVQASAPIGNRAAPQQPIVLPTAVTAASAALAPATATRALGAMR